jgi:hypothetical protein
MEGQDGQGQDGHIVWAPLGWPPGMHGFWSSSTDCSQKDRILPRPYVLDPSGWSYDLVPEPYATMPTITSHHAARLRTIFDKPLQGIWGANMGFDFAQDTAESGVPWPPVMEVDAGSAADVYPCRQGSARDFNGAVVDLNLYSGLTFWAMAWPGGRQSIRVQVNDWQTDPRGGYCSSSRSTDQGNCYNSFGKSFMLTDTFTQYTLAFSELRQDPSWGNPRGAKLTLDRGQIYSLNFLVALPGCTAEDSNANCAGASPPVAFDVWIDDLYFVNSP